MVYDVSFPYVTGGAQRRFYEVGRRLAARGWQVDWLTLKAWDGPDEIDHEGIRYLGVSQIPELYGEDGKRNAREPLYFAWKAFRRCPPLGDYDTVWIGQWPLLHVLPLLVRCRWTGVRTVLDWWEVWGYGLWTAYHRVFGVVGSLLESATLRVAAASAALVTDSPLEQGRMREVVGDGVLVRCIPNGIPHDEIGPLDERADEDIDVVSLGRLKDHKRVDLLVEAARVLRDRDGLTPSVAIIGDGPERETLEARAAALGLDNVTFHGYVADMREVYRMAKAGKVCAVTTVAGGGGNLTLLEAYGCGLPVVGFRVDEGLDTTLVEEGRTGYLVSPVTPEALADGLRRILSDPAHAESMRRHCVERACAHSWDAVSEQYESLFQPPAPA